MRAACFFILLLAGLWPCVQAVEKPPMADAEPKQLIETIRRAHEVSLLNVPLGAGTARVTISREQVGQGGKTMGSEQERLYVEYAFKGEKTRTDQYDLADGGKGNLKSKHINTGEVAYGLHAGRNAYIARGGGGDLSYYEKVGYDFHPRTFDVAGWLPLPKELEALLSDSRQFKSSIRSDGLLEINIAGNRLHEDWKRSATIVLDPQADCHVVEYDYASQWDEYGSSTTIRYTVERDAVFSALYPRRVVRELVEDIKDPNGRPPLTKTTIRTEVEILSFTGAQTVPDRDFTFEGLEVPVGTEVTDSIRDLRYLYGSPLDEEGQLGKLLTEPLVQPEAEMAESKDSLRPETQGAGIADTEGATTERSPRHSSRLPYVLAVLAAVIAASAVVLILRRRASRSNGRTTGAD